MWISIPAGFSKLLVNPDYNWRFATEPEDNVYGRTIAVPRGKGLGGSTLINGMIYVRGRPQEMCIRDSFEAVAQVVQLLARDVPGGLGRAHAFQVEADLLDLAQLFRIHIGHVDRGGGLHFQALFADEAEDGLAHGRDRDAHFLGQLANDEALSGFVLPVDQGVTDLVVDLDGEVLFFLPV